MLLPGVILIFIFAYIPLYGVIIAFEDYNPALGFASPWVGMKHFQYIFSQPAFLRTIWNTFFIAVMKLIGGIVVPVIFALLLNELVSNRLKRIFQTLIYIPNFLSWVIMAGVLMDILANNGIINQFLGFFGMDAVNFLGNASVFPWTMIVTDIWKGFGFGTVVYLAALTSIDPGLYESAILDGATRWQQIRYITLPLLMPTIILMLVLALGLAQLLNNPKIKGKGIFRTLIFLPCATSLVSYSMIFKSLFAQDGLVNNVITAIGFSRIDWFQNAWAARWVIILALIWRWTGYNMVFYLAGLQNIDYSVYEASYIDGATPFQQFLKITVPLLKPTILLTAIMSTSGTLQLFDESVNLTAGGPGKSTMTLAHYIYNISFVETPKFNYAAALSVFILVSVAILSAIQYESR